MQQQQYFYESFEQMAAGLAHEVRNPLSLVKANIELLALSETKEDSKRRYLIMQREIDRAAQALTELMHLAKPASVKPVREQLSLHTLLCGVIDTLRMTYTAVSFRMESAAGDYTIIGDEEKLRRVFGNVLKNAVEAVTELHPHGGGCVCLTLSARGSTVTIAIQDNGHGLTTQEPARAAEPFFTTKPDGNGLGLFISHAILAEHTGTLSIADAAGGGCIVTICLPLGKSNK